MKWKWNENVMKMEWKRNEKETLMKWKWKWNENETKMKQKLNENEVKMKWEWKWNEIEMEREKVEGAARPTLSAPRQARVTPKRTHCGLKIYASQIFIPLHPSDRLWLHPKELTVDWKNTSRKFSSNQKLCQKNSLWVV